MTTKKNGLILKKLNLYSEQVRVLLRKVLRNAGFALVLLPEPFTTPLGLALLGTAYLMGRFNRIDTPAYLRGFIKLYLTEARPSSNVIRHKLTQKLQDSEWRYQPKKDVPCGIDPDRLMLRFGKDMTIEFAEPATPIHHSIKDRWSGYVWPGTPPDLNITATATHIIGTSRLSVRYLEAACGGFRRPVAKTVHHSLNREWYGHFSEEKVPADDKAICHTLDISRLSAVYASSNAIRGARVDKAIHHSMKQDLCGYVLPSVPIYEEKAVAHAMDSSRLLQHYDKTMSSRPAAKKETFVHTFDKMKVNFALGMA